MFKFNTRKMAGLICLATILNVSCKKETLNEKVEVPKTASTHTLNELLVAGSPIPPLDWENISFMPAPAGVNIPVPWQGGLGGAKIDDDMIFDYHASEGWELVYNTFSATSTYNPQYFMLYNKYRGLLRTYFYVAIGGNYPSSNIAHFLNLRGANAATSPLLKFASDEVIDVGLASLSVAQIQSYKVSTTASWYAAEFEIAYDPNAISTPYEQLRLEWQINPNSITNMTFNGTQTGDISGTLQSTSSGPNFFSNIANGGVDDGLKVGSKAAAEALSFLPATIKSKIIEAATGGIGGLVKGFLSGILGGTTSTSTQKISLKINTNISITGSATTPSQLFDNIFSIPATQGVINTIPFYPKLEQPLGVFYVSNKPVINERKISELIVDESGRNYYVDQTYTVDANSFQLVFNPAVTNIANISNIKREVIMLNAGGAGGLGGISIGGDREDIAEKVVYVGEVTGMSRFGPRPLTIPSGPLAVRVSFDVIPKDGSPKSKIVKTFAANKVSI